MPYIGRGLTTGAQYQKLDDIAINNATTFTMSVGSANVSPDQNHLILVVNGVIQEPGTGFTVAGSTCTLASAITTSGHSGTDTIYGVIAGDAAFAAYDSIGVNALGVTAGTVTASRAIVPDSNKDIASFRNVTLTGELDSATLDVSGNADIDGTTNLDAVDIDGAVQIDATFTSGVDGQGYDTKFFGDTSSAYMLWDTSADDLVFAGAAGIDLAGDIDVDGTANLDVVDIDGAVDMASTLTLAGNADFNGDLDVDGTANLDIVDIDGAVNMAADLTMGANILMADDTSIGISDSAERIEFDGAGDISVLGANFGIGVTAPAEALHIYNSDACIRLENSGSTGIAEIYTNNQAGLIFDADPANGDNGTPIVFKTDGNEVMRLTNSGNVFIGDDANASMTIGLTINQGANDNEILAFKSSDVAHNMGNLAETDTYGTISKTDGGSGGLKITGYKDADGSTDGAVRIGGNLGEAADTAKTTGGYGVIRFIAQIGAGDDNTSVVGSNGNMVTIDNGGTTRFIFDADGDSHQDVGTAWTNFDNENDAMVSRSLGVVMGPDTIIKTKWDDWGRDHKEDLVRCGIMPELSPEEIKKGETPLVNTTQVMRLHNGAIWQQYTEMQKMKELMYDTMVEMLGKEKADKKLKDHDIQLLDNKALLN